MAWQIRLSSTAAKYYNRLNPQTRLRVKKELEALSDLENPLEHQSVKRLTGDLRGFCRLRVGKYRIVFAILEDDRTIAVVNIAPRGNVYK
ncbi:MAG: type II toxin-antitoxin system RelE/ParE family toxin [Thermodesulfovibrionales bacterium]|nr:type II toxin-antitoxin system RelE/ParE family toxin [Thermodesulfovibrionales bacterium]